MVNSTMMNIKLIDENCHDHYAIVVFDQFDSKVCLGARDSYHENY